MTVGPVRRAVRGLPWLAITMAAAIGASLAGIAIGIWGSDPMNGQRGGAAGCAMTFLMFFLSRPTASAALEAPLADVDEDEGDVLLLPPPADQADAAAQIEGLKRITARLRGATAAMLDAADREKVYLAVASVVSTLTWGFGDRVAGFFRGEH